MFDKMTAYHSLKTLKVEFQTDVEEVAPQVESL